MTSDRVGWKKHGVQALIDAGVLSINDGYRAKNVELGEDGLPFARAANINAGFQLEEVDHLQWDRVERAGVKRSRAGDVVFTSKGTVGRFAFVQPDTREFVYSPQLCFWRVLDRTVIEPRFLYYWMHGRECEGQFNAAKGSTDMADYISLRDQRGMSMTCPPVDDQRRIVGVLGSLDDKIECNRRLARTLDEIAATLFKARFVDFLGHEDFVDSQIGPIPAGWTVDRLGNHAETVLGGTPSRARDEYWTDGVVPWINSGKVNEFRILEPTALITEEALDNSAAKLMPSGTTVVAITGATLGQVSRLELDASANQSVIGILGNDRLPDEFLFFWIRQRIADLLSRQTGAAQQHINKGDVNDLSLLLPPEDEVSEFHQQTAPLLRRTASALLESRTLEGIRDTMLPWLISGKTELVQEPELLSTRAP